MDKNKLIELLEVVCQTSLEAGEEILAVYDSAFSIEQKEDKSPLTLADKKAHLKIVEHLSKLNYPILSEEGKAIPFEERKSWNYFWMVDPLDGTKEFIKRNGEFTVNVALIHKQKSILGVIFVPVKDELYFGAEGLGSYKINSFSKLGKSSKIENFMISENEIPKKPERPYTIVASRSHMSLETEEFIQEKKQEEGEVETISVGSSLKLCMVAEGNADEYPRFAPTMEWDTAAGQAIIESMGGKVTNWKNKETMKYNKRNLLNDWFLATK